MWVRCAIQAGLYSRKGWKGAYQTEHDWSLQVVKWMTFAQLSNCCRVVVVRLCPLFLSSSLPSLLHTHTHTHLFFRSCAIALSLLISTKARSGETWCLSMTRWKARLGHHSLVAGGSILSASWSHSYWPLLVIFSFPDTVCLYLFHLLKKKLKFILKTILPV